MSQLKKFLSRTVASEVHVSYNSVVDELGEDKAAELSKGVLGKTEKERRKKNSVLKASPSGKVLGTFNRKELLDALEKGASTSTTKLKK